MVLLEKCAAFGLAQLRVAALLLDQGGFCIRKHGLLLQQILRLVRLNVDIESLALLIGGCRLLIHIAILRVQLENILRSEELVLAVLGLQLSVHVVDREYFVWRLQVYLEQILVRRLDRIPEIMQSVRFVQARAKLHVGVLGRPDGQFWDPARAAISERGLHRALTLMSS